MFSACNGVVGAAFWSNYWFQVKIECIIVSGHSISLWCDPLATQPVKTLYELSFQFKCFVCWICGSCHPLKIIELGDFWVHHRVRWHSLSLLRGQDTNRSQEKCLRTKVFKCFVPLYDTVETAFLCNHWFSAKSECITVSGDTLLVY